MTTQDHNGTRYKIYDARVGGGFPAERVPPNCEAADECHGPSSTPPTLPPDRTSANLGAAKKHQAKKKHKKRSTRRQHKKKTKKKKRAARSAKGKKGGRSVAERRRNGSLAAVLALALLGSLAFGPSRAGAVEGAEILSFEAFTSEPRSDIFATVNPCRSIRPAAIRTSPSNSI